MKVYGLIVGAGASSYFDADPTTPLYVYYHPDSPPNMLPYKGYGFYNSGNWDDVDSGYVYDFDYGALLSFLRKHLDAEMLDDPTINQMDLSEFKNDYAKEYVNCEFYRYRKKNKPQKNEFPYDKFQSSIGRESFYMNLFESLVGVKNRTMVYLNDGTYNYARPVWALAMEIDVEDKRIKRINDFGCDYQRRITKRELLDDSPVSIMLHLIMEKLDEEDEKDSNSVSEELRRLKSIADGYDLDDELINTY